MLQSPTALVAKTVSRIVTFYKIVKKFRLLKSNSNNDKNAEGDVESNNNEYDSDEEVMTSIYPNLFPGLPFQFLAPYAVQAVSEAI